MSQPSQSDINAGQKIYNPWTLKLYNFVVLWFSNNWAWRCPRQRQLQHYQQYISNNHLDVGVGTGYYLDRVTFKTTPNLSLMDLNPDCLQYCQDLLDRYKPSIYQHDIFQPLDNINNTFDSIGLNYVLHCVPGTMEHKKTIIENLAKKLSPNGVLFGSTILGEGVTHNAIGKKLMGIYNKKQFFSNQNDSEEQLKKILREYFKEVHVEIIGAVALFSAYSPH